MRNGQRFCSECGAPLGENDRFCPVCGAKVTGHDTDAPLQKKSTVKKTPGSPPADNDEKISRPSKQEYYTAEAKSGASRWSSHALSSGLQWAIIWAIGWLPAGVLLSRFYDIKHALNPEFYAEYPRQWWSTLTGMTTTFTMGALIGGCIAGLLLYRILDRKQLSLGIAGMVFLLAWALFWTVLLGILTMDIQGMGMRDDTIYIAMYILSPVFAAVMSSVVWYFFKKKSDLHITKKQRIALGLAWAGCAVLALIMMSVLGDILSEIFRGAV